MLESNDILDDGQASAQSGFDQASAHNLIRSSGWISFLSILFYILGGLMSILFLLSLVGGARGVGSGGAVALVFIFMLSILVGLFVMGRQFQKLASATAALKYGGVNRPKTDQICESLRSVFATIGIYTIIVIVLGIVVSLVAGSMLNPYAF